MFKKKNLINIVFAFFAFFILLLPVFIHKISWEITSESLTLKNIYLYFGKNNRDYFTAVLPALALLGSFILYSNQRQNKIEIQEENWRTERIKHSEELKNQTKKEKKR